MTGNYSRLTKAMLVGSMLVVSAQGIALADPDSIPVWKPSPAMSKQLEPAAEATDFQIMRPKGYAYEEKDKGDGPSTMSWFSIVRADGSRGNLLVVSLTPPPDQYDSYSVGDAISKFLKGVRTTRSNWVKTENQEGTINGLTFFRCFWRGTDIATHKPMRGLMYATKTNGTFYLISSQDYVSQGRGPLDLAEASAMTFKAN